MKILVGFVLFFGTIFAMAEVLIQDQALTDSTAKISARDYKGFYLGFRETPAEKTFFTFRITEYDSTRNSIWFEYTLNTLNSRFDGEGRIYPDKGQIEFGNDNKGTVRSDQDGRIVFESLKSDTTKHWLMKEM